MAKAKKPKKFIQAANLKKGALTQQAKQAGFSSWQAYCNQSPEKLSTTAKRRCNLAKTLSRMAKGH